MRLWRYNIAFEHAAGSRSKASPCDSLLKLINSLTRGGIMPNFADSNRTAVRYVKEVTWGVTPTGPVMTDLPITSESFKSDITTVTSDTIRSDRNVADIVKVGGGASGDVGFEFKAADWDAFMEGALQSAFVDTRVSVGVASAFVSGAHIQADTSALYEVVSGQFLRISGASVTVNNGDYRVTAVSTISAGTKRVFLADASSGSAATFTSEVFDAGVRAQGKMIRNGVTPTSFTIEKQFSDVSSTSQFAGMRVGAMALAYETQAILTGTFGFVGKSEAIASATIASAVTAASTNPVMNASGNVGRIWEGGQAISSVYFKSLAIDINNNTRPQDIIGSDTLAGVATGRCEITGSFSAYFENNATASKFIAGTTTNFRTQTTDSNGTSYLITIPNVRLTEKTVVATGPNADVMQDYSWAAFVDDGGLYAIQIDILD